jgi:hypothetical protein
MDSRCRLIDLRATEIDFRWKLNDSASGGLDSNSTLQYTENPNACTMEITMMIKDAMMRIWLENGMYKINAGTT